jgi:hypothetical protein
MKIPPPPVIPEINNVFLFVLDLLAMKTMGLQLQRQSNQLVSAVCCWTNGVL